MGVCTLWREGEGGGGCVCVCVVVVGCVRCWWLVLCVSMALLGVHCGGPRVRLTAMPLHGLWLPVALSARPCDRLLATSSVFCQHPLIRQLLPDGNQLLSPDWVHSGGSQALLHVGHQDRLGNARAAFGRAVRPISVSSVSVAFVSFLADLSPPPPLSLVFIEFVLFKKSAYIVQDTVEVVSCANVLVCFIGEATPLFLQGRFDRELRVFVCLLVVFLHSTC